MRTFRFWAQAERDLLLEGTTQHSRVLAGSNVSEAEALQEAERRLDFVQARIQGGPTWHDDYEADIRETVLESPSEETVITRNRYGAHVLNCADLPIFDVDDPPSGFLDLFARRTPEWRLARMRKVMGTLAETHRAAGLGFRLYATAKGFRVIVVGGALAPQDGVAVRLAKALNVDPLYWVLCQKQGCYRARLTPKPHRMKAPTIRVPFPPTPEQQTQIEAWEQGYLAQAREFATCRFVQSFGSEADHPVVRLHDERTAAHSDRRLA